MTLSLKPEVWGYGPPLDWRRLFVVKGIGDELWMTYEVGDLPGDRAETQAEIARAFSPDHRRGPRSRR